MNIAIGIRLLGLGAFLLPLVSLAQIPPIAQGAYVQRSHTLVQTGANTVEERQAILSITIVGASTLPTTAAFELRGASVTLPLTRGTVGPFPPQPAFNYVKSFANSAELNAAVPPGEYSAVSTNVTPQVTYTVTISEAAPPPLILLNYSALQAWNGGDFELQWVQANFVDNVDVSLTRANGERVFTATSPAPGGVPPSSFLLPGANSANVRGVTAAPGEVLTGRINYIPPFLGFFATPTSGVRANLEFTMQRASALPVIATQPQGRSALAGDEVTLAVTATGTGLTYQWRKDGTAIAGATEATLAFRPAQTTDSGSYTVVVANTAGSVTSQAAVLTVAPRVVVPAIATAPAAQSVRAGASATLSVTATGTAPLAYQWLRNGAPIAGATQATLTLERARPSDRGQYSVTITNAVGTVTSSAVELTVSPVSRIANLSILTSLASASDNFTLGFVLGGPPVSATATKPVLVRAVGPSLVPLGVSGALDDPKLELYAGQTLSTANDNWGGDATLAGSFTAVGAFAFANAASRDAAATARVATSSNSIKILGSGSGLVLAELYDATTADDFGVASPRFANVSVLKQIGSGLTAGFVIDGSEPLRVLVRAIGPALGAFGVTGTVADPRLDLFQSGSAAAIASNDNWGAATNATQVAAAAASVGAFTLAPESRDAVLLVTLAPGSYTAQVSGVANTTGVALVEVYEVP